jgi:hypothetical protein
MTNLLTSVSRKLIHTRKITTQAFLREDGLWDLEANLLDTKTRDFTLCSGIRKSGDAIHDMTLCITIDASFNILDAKAVTHAAPYEQYCNKIEPEYKKLVGLNLVKGFRIAIKDLYSGVSGCSHITELCSVFPTVAIQSFLGEGLKVTDQVSGQMPFQLNGCHALRTDGEAVKNYHPAWFGAPIVDKNPRKKS